MIKPYADYNPMTKAYSVGMETTKHLYIFMITTNQEEAHGMTHLINQILGLTK